MGIVRRRRIGHHVGKGSRTRHRSVGLWACARRMHSRMRRTWERYGARHRGMCGRRHAMGTLVTTSVSSSRTRVHWAKTNRRCLGVTLAWMSGVGRVNGRNRRGSLSRSWKRWPAVHQAWIHWIHHGRIGRQQMRLEGVRHVQDVRRHFCVRLNQVHGRGWGSCWCRQCTSRCLR